MPPEEAYSDLRVYGRRSDHALKPRPRRLMEELLPVVAITPETAAGVIGGWHAEHAETASRSPEGRALAPRSSSERERAVAPQTWLEVGFGGGEHLAWQARRDPSVLIIGVEPFLNGVAKLLGLIDDDTLGNVRVHKGDARRLMAAMPDGCLDRMFVLHPDPWPKRKHHKRRIVSQPFLADAHRLLRPGGELRVASDIPDYVRWTLMHVDLNGGFDWTARRMADWTERPEDWPQTRYEAKALREGRVPTYLSFRRR